MTIIDRRWIDGRTGAAGRIAGDAVLADLSRALGNIRHVKGTIFETANDRIIGRCASDQYLLPPEVHWSTYEPDQQNRLAREPSTSRKNLSYLFITLMPDNGSVAYWLIPASVLTAAVSKTKPRGDGAVFVRIHQRNGRTFLFDTDVTAYRKQLVLDVEQRNRVAMALALGPRRKRRSQADDPPDPLAAVPPPLHMIGSENRIDKVSIGADGTICLPQWLRQGLSLTQGMHTLVFVDGQRIVLQPIRPGEYKRSRGISKGSKAFDIMMEERRREREL